MGETQMARIPALDPYRKPAPPGGPFAALTWQQQRTAEQWLWKFCQRRAGDLPQWRLAILVGVAKRLARNPLGPDWSRHMFAIKGGKAAQRRHRRERVDVMALARAGKVSNKLKTAQNSPVRHLDL
jgi:hypothetical protein